MATGFKVADAYVAIHTEDDTRPGRDKIERDTKRWSLGLGDGIAKNILRGMLRGLAGMGAILAKVFAVTAKFSLLAIVVGTVAVAIAGLLGYLVQLLPVLQNLIHVLVAATGALLLIPAAIATLVTALVTLKLAFKGVGDALKAGLTGDMEAFNEALKKLAPNAQAFVREIVRLKPAWDRLRLQVQNTLFADLANILRKIAEVYLPVLTAGLDAMSAALNRAFKAIATFLLGADTQADIGTIMFNAAAAADALGRALFPALQILRDVLVVSTQVFSTLAGKLLPVIQSWAESIARMREDGSLEQLILDGVTALKMLGGLLADIIGLFGGLARAAAGTTSGTLFTFFDRINKLVNSPSGQAALSRFFDALARSAEALTPVLAALFTALVPVFEGIAVIAEAFSPALVEFFTVLGAALAGLAPGFVALTPLIGVLADALIPIAQILVGLVTGLAAPMAQAFENLLTVLQILAPVAQPVGEALGFLALVFTDLILLIAPFATVLLKLLAQALVAILRPLEPLVRALFPLFVRLAGELLKAFEPLIPVLIVLFTTILTEIVKHTPEIVTMFGQWVEIVRILAEHMAGEFLQVLYSIIPLLPELVSDGLELAKALTALTIAVLPVIIGLIRLLVVSDGLQNGLYGLTFVIDFVSAAIVRTAEVVRFVIFMFGWLKDRLFELLSAARRLGVAISELVTNGLTVLWTLGQRIVSAFANFGSLLYNAGRSLIQGLLNGIRDAIPGLSGLLGWVSGKIGDWKGPLDKDRLLLVPAGQATLGGYIKGIESQIPQLRELLGGLTGGIPGMAVPGLAGTSTGAAAEMFGAEERPIYVMVQIGDRPVREMVKAEIISDPVMVADATREGDRQNAWASPGRRRIGTS